MPTTWSDLPNEIRKLIVSYVVADDTVHYIQVKHREAELEKLTNSRRRPQLPEHLQYLGNDLYPVILVSKRFLIPAEVNDAILKNATIKYHKKTDLKAMNSRFGEGATGYIKRLYIVTDDWEQWDRILLPPRILDQMSSLEQLLVGGEVMFMRTEINCDYITLAEIASGRCPDSCEARQSRCRAKYILEDLIKYTLTLGYVHPFDFLNPDYGRRIERIIDFKVWWWHDNVKWLMPMQFSSFSLCCSFSLGSDDTRNLEFMLPQRLIQDTMSSEHDEFMAAIDDVPMQRYWREEKHQTSDTSDSDNDPDHLADSDK